VNASLVYGMPEAEYHAHPALSSTGARRLLPPGCPARFDHDRRNPPAPSAAMRLGRAAHRLILGAGSEFAVDSWPNYRTKAAQEWRDESEASGLIPLLRDSKEWRAIEGMRDALQADPSFRRLFDPERGTAEASIFWTDEETGVECRARLDFLPDPVDGRRLVVPDYKKTRDAFPGAFTKDAAQLGYPMQADWYLRGVRALGLDPDPAFVFVAQEAVPPYLVSVNQLQLEDLNHAHERNRRALYTFAHCTAKGEWPGYVGVHQTPMPLWWRIESEALTEGSPE